MLQPATKLTELTNTLNTVGNDTPCSYLSIGVNNCLGRVSELEYVADI